MSTEPCLICQRIDQIKTKQNPFFVKEFPTGYVVFGDTQFALGYTLFLSKWHLKELHLLERHDREQFLLDMADVAEAVYKAFKPAKLNYELMGNSDEHMHWHLIPRHNMENNRHRPYWNIPAEQRNDPQFAPNEARLNLLKIALRKYL